MALPGGQEAATQANLPGTFRLHGEVDLNEADRLEAQLIAYAQALPGQEVEIDCSDLEFVDSSGLGMLVDVQNETGKHVVLVDLPNRCRRVFELTGLDTVFKIA